MASMRLLRFRVLDFRSVSDSGWVTTEAITALIGTNEAGKTNLLVPLWKLNPAKDGEINPIADFPRKRYNEFRNRDEHPVFIEADFELNTSLIQQLIKITGANEDDVREARVSRRYDGKYDISFPNEKGVTGLAKSEVAGTLDQARTEIAAISPSVKAEEAQKEAMLAALAFALAEVDVNDDTISKEALVSVQHLLHKADTESQSKKSSIVPRFLVLIEAFEEFVSRVSHPLPTASEAARTLVQKALPKFVFYSNYGNLDSEIYLPHVIQNMKRTGLGSKEEAKVRTLKVLFDFVRLEPDEILELGKDFRPAPGQPTPTQDAIDEIAVNKKEREILLQSASTELTAKFKDWWKQGDYRFRFNADGDHFRIWVSDDRRPEEIELEGRSTGLQWFLSFYLIFLVESQDSHENSILLLDEPGLSLHPLAQHDLSDFFENLSLTNQILYTTHSPFMVDADHLDRVKAVYVDAVGATAVSANLRASEGNSAQTRSIYPVHAALGLSVSQTLLQGCQPVIIEGASDQFYLSGIKNYLISRGMITPKRELLFIPAGGAKGIVAVSAIVAGKEEALPYVLADADGPGQSLVKQLLGSTYKGYEERIISLNEYCAVSSAEVEDLFPPEFLAKIVDRLPYFRAANPDDDFSETLVQGKPFVDQTQQFAERNSIVLPKGWKVELAAAVKERLTKPNKAGKSDLADDCEAVTQWVNLFARLNGEAKHEVS